MCQALCYVFCLYYLTLKPPEIATVTNIGNWLKKVKQFPQDYLEAD